MAIAMYRVTDNALFVEMYPEFCTAHYNQTFALAYKKQSEKLLAKRNTTKTNAAQQANGQHTIRNTIVQQKKWLLLFAVFIYVVLSRLTARFSSTTGAN
jgi:hypothetical protein